MLELLDSWRQSPRVPAQWRPRPQPGAIIKVSVKNTGALRELRKLLPGRWMKIYHYGVDGSAVHYFQHSSGKVASVKYKPPRL
jgi:hypothetical protein